MFKKLTIKTCVFCFINISFWLTTEISDFCRAAMDTERALEVEGRAFLKCESPLKGMFLKVWSNFLNFKFF